MEIKDVLDIFEGRESIRVYDLEKPLEDEKLEAILKAGILSPSSVGLNLGSLSWFAIVKF